MDEDHSNAAAARAAQASEAFGSLIRSRRKAMNMRQDQLALATGVGRRFLIDLEAGKPSCHLGLSLLVADAVGLKLKNILAAAPDAVEKSPDLPDEIENG